MTSFHFWRLYPSASFSGPAVRGRGFNAFLCICPGTLLLSGPCVLMPFLRHRCDLSLTEPGCSSGLHLRDPVNFLAIRLQSPVVLPVVLFSGDFRVLVAYPVVLPVFSPGRPGDFRVLVAYRGGLFFRSFLLGDPAIFASLSPAEPGCSSGLFSWATRRFSRPCRLQRPVVLPVFFAWATRRFSRPCRVQRPVVLPVFSPGRPGDFGGHVARGPWSTMPVFFGACLFRTSLLSPVPCNNKKIFQPSKFFFTQYILW